MTPWPAAAAVLLLAASMVSWSRAVYRSGAVRGGLLTSRIQAGGPLTDLSPRLKLLGVVAVAAAASLTPVSRLWVPLLLLAVLTWTARVPPREVAGRFAELAPFAVIAAVGGLFGGDPWRFVAVMARALATVWALVLLLATTALPDLLAAARRLGCPRLMVTMLGLALRYLEVLVEEASRMSLGFTLRAVGPRNHRLLKPLGRLVGSLAVRTIERGERVYGAMLLRGYVGDLPSCGGADRLTAGALAGFALWLAALAAGAGWR